MFENIELKKFSLSENGFVIGNLMHKYEDEYHGFDEIKHLFFRQVHIIQKLNFSTVGEADKSELVITLLNNKKLRISIDESGILFINKNKQAELSNLKDFYLCLAQQSFHIRLLHYRKEIEEKGYFEYDGCRFYPANRIILFRDIAFPRDTSEFLLGQGYIEMRKKHRTTWDKVKKGLSLTKLPRFCVNTDTDIIFFLLEKYFGMRWT